VPRDLGDVLHYFFQEAEPTRSNPVVMAVPLSERDVVRAALVWNLAVEVARRGGRTCVVTRPDDHREALWPRPGRGPLGVELVLPLADGPEELARAARETAERGVGLVLVPVPPEWLEKAGDAGNLFERTLLLCSPSERDLRLAWSRIRTLLLARPRAEVGVTIHGPRSVAEARAAFDRLDQTSLREFGRNLVSYGLLVDDVHVCRAIVSRRPVGLTHPGAAAARALQDVARLLVEDAGG
jgi:hypothetical protein